jgi:hypothetical protein
MLMTNMLHFLPLVTLPKSQHMVVMDKVSSSVAQDTLHMESISSTSHHEQRKHLMVSNFSLGVALEKLQRPYVSKVTLNSHEPMN